MKHLILILLFPALMFSQGIEPFQIQGSPYENGILKAITKVYDETVMDSVYLYQHSNILYSRIDSMIYQNDTLYVYTQDSTYKAEIISGGSGGPDSTIIIDGYGINVAESPANTWTVSADTAQLATQHDISGFVPNNRTISTTAPLSGGGDLSANRTFSMTQSNASTNGWLSSGDWTTFNNKVGGSGTATRVAFWDGTSSLSSNSNLYWDNVNSRIGINTSSPTSAIDLLQVGINEVDKGFTIRDNAASGGTRFKMVAGYPGYYDGYLLSLRNTTVMQGIYENGVQYYQNLELNENTGNVTTYKYRPIQHSNSWISFNRDNTDGRIHYASWGGQKWITSLNQNAMHMTSYGNLGINLDYTTGAQRTLDVNGEVRVRDLTTDTPTNIVGSDADGDLGTVTIGTGLSLSGGTLSTVNNGTVTSVGLSTGTTGTDVSVSGSPVTGSGTITLNIPTVSSSNRGVVTSALHDTWNAKVGGSGTTNQFAYFSGSNTLTSSPVFSFNTHGVTLQKGTWNAFINGGNNTLTGTGNAAMGSNQTLASLTSGANNVGIGNAAGFSNTTGSNNFYLGNIAGYSNVSSDNNVFLGGASGYTVTGGDNCYIGGTSGYNAGASSATTAIGGFAGFAGGSSNVDIGFYAGFNATGSFNTRIGRQAGQNASASTNNIYIGYAAGQGNTGSNNTIIGHLAGQTGDGSNNVFLGYTAGNTETGSDLLYIENSTSTSPLIGGNFSSDRVGINTAVSSIARTLHVTGEMRVTDLTTDTPTRVIGADADGDLGSMTVGNGVTVSSGQVGLTGQALALHNFTTNGIMVRTGSGTYAGRTIENGQGVLVTNGDGVAGNPSLFNVICSHGQLFNTGNLANQTLDATAREIDFTSNLSNNMTVSTAGNSITIPATGTYEVTYSFSYSVNATGLHSIYFELYKGGVDYGYNGQTRSRQNTSTTTNPEIFTVSRSFLADFTSSDVLELYYRQFLGTATQIDFYNANFSVKRLK